MKKIKNKRLFPIAVIIIALIIVISGVSFLIYFSSDEYKFKKIGYSKEEITVIIETIKEKDLTNFLNQEYIPNLSNILSEEYFIYENLDRYLNYLKENSDNEITDIIGIVNSKSDYEFYTNVEDTDISKKELILVNKHNKLDKNYVPENLVPVSNWYAFGTNELVDDVYGSFKNMYTDAKKENLTLIITSSYRSYQSQENIYNDYVNSRGRIWADGIAARPGHSEHQTGLTFDLITNGISDINDFENTDEFKWVEKNAHKYGFILRYPKDKEHITGYNYESWHYRYVGKEVATKIYELQITFDEYYEFFLR